MDRPKIEDFKPKYTKGVAGIASVAKQFVKAQDLYIDHLEQLLIHNSVVDIKKLKLSIEQAQKVCTEMNKCANKFILQNSINEMNQALTIPDLKTII